jgi:uncharacterized protein YutE (UPF0331/DUF86 family)
VADPRREILDRKLAVLRQFLADLGPYGTLDAEARRRDHYAIERLLQLLCESAADIGLQTLKRRGAGLSGSYREVFSSLHRLGLLPAALAERLIDACGMRNVLTHLYDTIDLERVIAAIEPALSLYREYLDWALKETAGWD